MKPLIIDTHCHLDDDRYNDDIDEVMQRADKAGVRGILLPGADISTLPKARQISQKFKNVYFAAGVHPYHQKEYHEETIEEFLVDKKCIAIGECGLDYSRLPSGEREKEIEKNEQKKVFIAQIELAKKYNKPLIVHIREASQDSFDILQENAVKNDLCGVLHCYNASELLLDLEGFYFGIGGVLTFSNAKKLLEILPRIPKNRLLLETDAPYLSPMPHRGQRNEPAYTHLVLEKASKILNIKLEELAHICSQNTKRLFKDFEKLI